MASSATKCPTCGKSVPVGLVSQTILQHDDRHGQRCPGSGQFPAQSATRAASAASAGSAPRAAKKAATSPPTKGGVTVRRVEVDPEVLRERQERSERLRQERAEAARDRNDVNVSYFDGPGA
ncbi:hypothetical protein ACEXQD_15775 [Herbiconiux sp. P15]|uniref:hypothetical protein n=1 Tax=Herbiconiux liukaitaii TaxID=3342799 RepID=UPI0035B7A159